MVDTKAQGSPNARAPASGFPMTDPDTAADPFEAWFNALYTRHTANLKFAEVRRALQALSSLYVQRRERLATGAVFDGAGKRAAFALFYTPLHFLLGRAVVQALNAPARRITDLGCGTGAVGAAWASTTQAPVRGVDINTWALGEARWNFAALRVRGEAQRGDVTAVKLVGEPGHAVVAAFTVNEISDEARSVLLQRFQELARAGSSVLVIEPIARRMSPWWPTWETAFTAAGGRCDEWKLRFELPEKLRLLDKAAGLDHGMVKARSLYLPGLFMST